MLEAKLVVRNSNVVTMDESKPEVDGFAVWDDKFVEVGSNDDIESYIGPNTEVLEFPEGTILPGFYDAHTHFTSACQNVHQKVNLRPSEASSVDEIIEKISEEASETPEDDWIFGTRYDDTKLKEDRDPTRSELDSATTDHPVIIMHASGHHGVINTRAIEKAGWEDGVPEELSQFVHQNRDGELNGIIHEDAKDAIKGGRGREGIIPDPSQEENIAAIPSGCEKFHSVGLTSAADLSGTPDSIGMLMDGYEEGVLSVRVTTVVRSPHWKKLDEVGIRTGFGDEFFKIGPVKATLDGAIASRTAYLNEPYEGRPNDYGNLRMEQDEVDELVEDAHDCGWQIALHANGDATIEMVLEAYEAVLEDEPKDDHRYRIEHCTVTNDQLLERISDLDLVVNPFATYLYQHGEKMDDYGDRIKYMFAHGSFLEHDIAVTGNTDHPAGTLDPLLGIQTMVTRQTNDGRTLGERQKIDVETAIELYTLGSAYSMFEEDKKGSITSSKLADFIVLDDDPRTVNEDEIADINVEYTFVGGEEVYSAQ